MGRIGRQAITGAAALIALLVLASCDTVTMPVAPLSPEEPRSAPQAAPGPAQMGAQSELMRAYFARVQAGLLQQGLLRQDGGGDDAPFTDRELARNFERIALYEEYANIGGRVVARQTESRVHRWEQPIRMQVNFGATVPEQNRARDLEAIRRYVARLSQVTGLSMRLSDFEPNFHIFIVNEPERERLGPRIETILPGISSGAVRAVTEMPRSTFCLVFAWDPGDTGTYAQAVAVIRGEHPDLLRLSCIHEEIAQGLGLANDSPVARPSVFNDDEEFALLTRHDELLLKMLYSDRIRPGMSAEEARALAPQLAAEVMGIPPVLN